MEDADFSGYATKAGLKCSDGRTIMKDAFAHQDKQPVPLVWSHSHNDPENVLGKVYLENRDDGVYCYGYFNESAKAQHSKQAVQHKDITFLSIYANQLVERSKQVYHGAIREVSLVLAGANPGALIEQVRLAHSDNPEDDTVLEDAAVIYTGLEIKYGKSSTEEVVHADKDETGSDNEEGTRTVEEIYDEFDDEEKTAVHFMIGKALAAAGNLVEHSGVKENESAEVVKTETQTEVAKTETKSDEVKPDESTTETKSDDTNPEGDLTHQEGNTQMNVFDQNDVKETGPRLNHSQIATIIEDAEKLGSFKDSLLAHAQEYGIENIDILFPDAKNISNTPDIISRRQEWVQDVLGRAQHSPFSRIKSRAFDLTADEARAKGYVKGNLKKDEIIKLLKRVTTPTTIYKKQKLDRDDIVDITDFDVVVWLKGEMRMMLDEEIARAVLLGDGRESDDEDKVDEDHIRPIAYDVDMYSESLVVASELSPESTVEAILRARSKYKGTGSPTFYTTDQILTDLLLIKDKVGRRIYETEADVAAAIRCNKVVTVEVMEEYPDIVGIVVNMTDYTIGADQGGKVAMFDDFDIDYNQYKYLIESRVSGCLTKPKSAIVVKRTLGTVVSPTSPSYNGETHELTFPNTAGVVYEVNGSNVTGTVVIEETTDVDARPATGYSFPPNTVRNWTYVYTA